MHSDIANKETMWINPIGGLGDILMVSSVLKLVVENDPSRKFNLVRRPPYLSILKGHPAIAAVGYPPRDATIIGTDYWAKEEPGPGIRRAFQILARMFGLSTPVKEVLYFPSKIESDPLLDSFIPWGKKNVLIAPASVSPRKAMHPSKWFFLIDKLHRDNVFVMQIGQLHEPHIKNAYSLLGLTTPSQILSLIKKCDVVITCDNFVMHAAYLIGIPAVVLWGPTDPQVYGYAGQCHLKAAQTCELVKECIVPKPGNNYQIPCPLESHHHCMNQIAIEDIYNAVQNVLT